MSQPMVNKLAEICKSTVTLHGYPELADRCTKEALKIAKCAAVMRKVFGGKMTEEERIALCSRPVDMLQMDEIRKLYVKDAYQKYTKESLKNWWIGILSFGKCNFSCIYCKRGGYFKDDVLRITGARPRFFAEVLDAAIKHAEKCGVVRASGGEPTLFKDEVKVILKAVKTVHPETKTSVATNASCWPAMENLVDVVDIWAVDLKGPRRYVEKITGVPPEISFDLVAKNIRKLSEKAKFIEVRTPIFAETTVEDLEEIAKALPLEKDNVVWTWRPYYKVEGVDLEPPSKEYVYKLLEEFLKRHPELKGKIYIRRKGW